MGSLSCVDSHFALLPRPKFRCGLCTKVVQIIYRQSLDDRCLRRADSTLESRKPVL